MDMLMRKSRYINMLLILFVSLWATTAQAGFALDVHGGLNGVGVGGTVGVNKFFNIRAGVNSLEEGADFEEDGVDYQVDLEFDNQYLKLDFHPFAGSFRITFGMYSNDNALTGSARVNTTTTIGDGADIITFNATGGVNLTVDYESSTASYVGIGFGNAVRGDGGLGFSVDIGVIDTGSFVANVALDQDANNAALSVPGTTQADIDSALAAEVAEVNQEFDDIDVWPLVQIGISYGF